MQVQNVTSPPSEALRKAQAEQTRLQTELTSLQEDHSDLLARHNDASKRFQAQLACIAQAGGDLPSPCGTCASLSADVAALSAQLAAAKTEASRCAALQKLCDEQASALDRMRKLAVGGYQNTAAACGAVLSFHCWLLAVLCRRTHRLVKVARLPCRSAFSSLSRHCKHALTNWQASLQTKTA